MNVFIRVLAKRLEQWPSAILTVSLIMVGLAYIGIGLFVENHAIRALALAYGVLP